MKTKEIIIILVMLFSVSVNIIVGYNFIQLQQKFDTNQQKFNTYYALEYATEYNESRSYGLNGVYYKGIMCVVLDGRDWADVMETCNHEFLHYKWDTGHFER